MFTVIWTGRAFDQMARIIRSNPARKDELAEALRDLDTRLRAQAGTAGESRVETAGPLRRPADRILPA